MAPDFISKDTYDGRHRVRGVPRNARAGLITAARIASHASEGVIWESFGTLNDGREGFRRSRYIADSDGRLNLYNSDGALSLTHPPDRKVRILLEATE